MAEDEVIDDEAPKKRSKMPLIVGLVLALLGGGAGFFVTSSGMLSGGSSEQVEAPAPEMKDLPDVTFVAVEPLVINLAKQSHSGHLRFRASLEVKSAYADDVEKIMPRIVDVLNTYLRAVALEDLTNPAALTDLRAQMLRRVQLVTGEGRITDLLIMEFVVT